MYYYMKKYNIAIEMSLSIVFFFFFKNGLYYNVIHHKISQLLRKDFYTFETIILVTYDFTNKGKIIKLC